MVVGGALEELLPRQPKRPKPQMTKSISSTRPTQLWQHRMRSGSLASIGWQGHMRDQPLRPLPLLGWKGR